MFKKKLISKFRHLSKTDGRFFFKIIKVKYIYYNFIFVFILVYQISLNIGSENKSLISHAEKNFAINWTKSNKKTSCIRKCLRSSGELYFFFWWFPRDVRRNTCRLDTKNFCSRSSFFTVVILWFFFFLYKNKIN